MEVIPKESPVEGLVLNSAAFTGGTINRLLDHESSNHMNDEFMSLMSSSGVEHSWRK